jgi:hypothetical protein
MGIVKSMSWPKVDGSMMRKEGGWVDEVGAEYMNQSRSLSHVRTA